MYSKYLLWNHLINVIKNIKIHQFPDTLSGNSFSSGHSNFWPLMTYPTWRSDFQPISDFHTLLDTLFKYRFTTITHLEHITVIHSKHLLYDGFLPHQQGQHQDWAIMLSTLTPESGLQGLPNLFSHCVKNVDGFAYLIHIVFTDQVGRSDIWQGNFTPRTCL